MPTNEYLTRAILDCLEADDPLSEEHQEFLVNFREETTQLDFKLKPRDDEKAWIDLAIDVSSLANMYGGYLVYGVKNSTFEVVGLNGDDAALIANTERLVQKVGSFVDPPVQTLRSKVFELDGKTLGIVCTRKSPDTHIFKRDANYEYTTGTGATRSKLVVQKGIVYVRTASGNSRLDVSTLPLLLDRRFDDYREKLLENITRVVQAPSEAKIVVAEQSGVGGVGIILTDDPNADSVSNIQVRLEPRSLEEQVAAFHLLRASRPDAAVPCSLLWECYEKRHSVKFTKDHELLLATYGAVSDVPSFFWFRGASKREVRHALYAALEIASDPTQLASVLTYARLLPKNQFDALARKVLTKRKTGLSQKLLKYENMSLDWIYSRPSKGNDELEEGLNQIAAGVRENSRGFPGAQDRMTAKRYDWRLYAPRVETEAS